MDTDKHDRLSPSDDGEFSGIVCAAIDEIRREEPQYTAVEAVVTRALRIPDSCFRSSSYSNWRKAGGFAQPREAEFHASQRQHSEVVVCVNPTSVAQ